jgi:hypothetical protein
MRDAGELLIRLEAEPQSDSPQRQAQARRSQPWASLADEGSGSHFTFKGESVINHPEILADIARQHRAEMIAAADEFQRAKQLRRLWQLGRKLRRPVIRAEHASGRSGPSQHSHPAALEGHAHQLVSEFATSRNGKSSGLSSAQKSST